MAYVIGVLSVLAVVQAVCVWRVIQMARVVPRSEERLGRLTHSIELLANTTEGCFNSIAAQLADRQPAPAARRDTRQRRVVGAARRGRSVAEIAVQEELSESEVSLRLHLAHVPNEGSTDHAALRA